MWLILAIVALFLFLWADNKTQPSVGNVRSKFFGPDSIDKFNELKRDGVSSESLKEFLSMEDRVANFIAKIRLLQDSRGDMQRLIGRMKLVNKDTYHELHAALHQDVEAFKLLGDCNKTYLF
jgi:hypothetical protein